MTRHHRTLQRKDPDAFGGSLCRFDCIRRTIVATSRFAEGANPITLPDGGELVDLLSEHGSDSRQRTTEPLEMNAETFVTGEMDSQEQRGVR